ncbi:dopamine receptor 2-like [Dendronephthya gigantea]|uniref:dopamine receptor 2-like n=1 Tax=Dendronephthya gigantea TaxID=151771 RepID=UPI00106A5C4E|nr:dopamine receptor 2-like [Dendronephthya gigantea]
MENNTTDAIIVNPALSQHPPPNQTAAQFSKEKTWLATSVILIAMIIAIVVGNVLVLVTTWLDKRLHQPNKYFVACLAVADLLVGVFSVPIRLHLHLNETTLAPIYLCRFWTWMDISCEVASIATLTIISIDRYFKISHPFEYRSRMSTSRSVFIISTIWLISGVHATLGLFPYGDSHGVVALVGRGCIIDNKIYLTVTSAIFFFIPLLIMLVMYCLVFTVAHAQQKRNRKGKLGRTMSSRRRKSVNKEFYQELKTVRMLLLVVGAFTICWMPFFVLFFLVTYSPEYLPTSRYFQQILGTICIVILPSLNSLCNPVIYACFDREYSSAFKRLFKMVLSCKMSSGRERYSSATQSLSPNTRSNVETQIIFTPAAGCSMLD